MSCKDPEIAMNPENEATKILEVLKIVDKAISFERNAQRFYKRVSELVESAEGKKTFLWLADFEKSHEARLKSRRSDLVNSPILAGVTVPVSFENTSMSEADTTGELDADISDTDIIIMAIRNEERIRSYYERKLSHVEDPELAEIFGHLMKEEARHKKILQDQMQHIEINHRWGNLESIVQNND